MFESLRWNNASQQTSASHNQHHAGHRGGSAAVSHSNAHGCKRAPRPHHGFLGDREASIPGVCVCVCVCVLLLFYRLYQKCIKASQTIAIITLTRTFLFFTGSEIAESDPIDCVPHSIWYQWEHADLCPYWRRQDQCRNDGCSQNYRKCWFELFKLYW